MSLLTPMCQQGIGFSWGNSRRIVFTNNGVAGVCAGPSPRPCSIPRFFSFASLCYRDYVNGAATVQSGHEYSGSSSNSRILFAMQHLETLKRGSSFPC